MPLKTTGTSTWIFVKTKRYERMNLGGRKYKITHKGFFLKKTLI